MMRKNMVASVLARLRNIAKTRNVIFGEILLRYAVERVLKRIEESEYASQCILKGGALLFVWGGGSSYRPTMDADLELRGDGSPAALVNMFSRIAEMPGEAEDGVRIGKESIKAVPIRDDDEYGGVRVTMTVFLGKVRVPVQFDVGIGDAITPSPKKADFPVLLDGSIPRIKVYPKETVIAEKFETIVKRGLANSRMKDYYDLWMLSHDASVDKDTASRAIERTFNRRKTDMPERVPEGLLDEFARNDSKIIQWKAFVRKNRILLPNADFSSVVRDVREFLMGLVQIRTMFSHKRSWGDTPLTV
ncbi:MAG: nucleotidyl transferase AbiEii/AbiGii toxin family protein [Kiritimatiellae bacterium]|nr:nucleotidyl transferase AbiEii/AbiGii toxin family protein [Kiritimatiellia bacterium]